MAIHYWNRRSGRMETESVYGEFFVDLLYGNPLGRTLADNLLARKFVSRIYGARESAPSSAKRIAPFIKTFRIPMEQFEEGPFRSFNDFFVRRFRPGLRPFPSGPDIMGAPAEARYLAFADSSSEISLPVKGLALDPLALLGRTPGKERFRKGPCLLARLCPVDYHRFHFPDSGRILHMHSESGKLHSVNPAALKSRPRLFLTNERRISLLETEHFGPLAYVEVGALCVGRIVQTHPDAEPFARGEEKGYFLFGASTVIIYGEPGAWSPAQDLLERTAQGVETLVELGQAVAKARSKV